MIRNGSYSNVNFLEQVTGGSLEESREALAIAETDGLFYCFTDLFLRKFHIFIILFIMDVHLQAGCSARLVFIQLDAMSVFFVSLL